jgi:BirA family biotin operon repressor/biotin-[acetyl-CoA-carboxylase] ligase
MIQWDIQCYDTLPSTQSFLKSLSTDQPLTQGACVQALEQTAGQGRHGRVWNSPKGNLYVSLFLKPKTSQHRYGEIALLISVALAKAIMSLTDKEPLLKWPNDVLVRDYDGHFKKVAGILLESHDSGVVIGAGVNTQTPAAEGTALDVDAIKFRNMFLSSISDLYLDWTDQGFDDVQSRWLDLSFPVGASISVKVGQNIHRGDFAGLGDNGTLLLRGPDGTITPITSGDVYVTGH